MTYDSVKTGSTETVTFLFDNIQAIHTGGGVRQHGVFPGTHAMGVFADGVGYTRVANMMTEYLL
jgi:hypothetical protein